MLGIVFTTPQEASAFVDQYAETRVDRIEAGSSVQLNDLWVGVTGVGKIHATLTTERLLQSHAPDTLIHAGSCASLTDDLDYGTVVGASFVLEGDRVELDDPTYPRMPLSCPLDGAVEGTLVSQDHTPTGDDSTYWERLADVRDSTGYAVAYVAAQHGTECHIIKAVADGPNAPDTSLNDRRGTAAAEVASALDAFLKTRNEADA
jgi:nucleoside phosphorylase